MIESRVTLIFEVAFDELFGETKIIVNFAVAGRI